MARGGWTFYRDPFFTQKFIKKSSFWMLLTPLFRPNCLVFLKTISPESSFQLALFLNDTLLTPSYAERLLSSGPIFALRKSLRYAEPLSLCPYFPCPNRNKNRPGKYPLKISSVFNLLNSSKRTRTRVITLLTTRWQFSDCINK